MDYYREDKIIIARNNVLNLGHFVWKYRDEVCFCSKTFCNCLVHKCSICSDVNYVRVLNSQKSSNQMYIHKKTNQNCYIYLAESHQRLWNAYFSSRLVRLRAPL